MCDTAGGGLGVAAPVRQSDLQPGRLMLARKKKNLLVLPDEEQ